MMEVNRKRRAGYAFENVRNGDVYAIRDAHGKAGAYAIREYLCCQEMRVAKGCTGHAGREWRPRNGCGATVREQDSRNPRDCAGVHKKERAPRAFRSRGCEPWAAGTDRP